MHAQHLKFPIFLPSCKVYSLCFTKTVKTVNFSPERKYLNCQLTKRLIYIGISCSSFKLSAFSSASYTDPEWQLFLPSLLSCFRQQMGLIKHSSHHGMIQNIFSSPFTKKKVPLMIVIRYWHWINFCESEWRSPAIFDAHQQKRGYLGNLQHSHH